MKVGDLNIKFNIEVPKTHRFRMILAKPFVFIAQWLIGQPIKISAVQDTQIFASKPMPVVFPGTMPNLRGDHR